MSVESHLKELFSLEGKTILLTGAAGGIGGALAKGMAGIGGAVCLCDVSKERLQALEEEIRQDGGTAEAYVMDVTKKESIQHVVSAIAEKYGKIDVLCNVAGIN